MITGVGTLSEGSTLIDLFLYLSKPQVEGQLCPQTAGILRDSCPQMTGSNSTECPLLENFSNLKADCIKQNPKGFIRACS